jgi:hypothetical protein
MPTTGNPIQRFLDNGTFASHFFDINLDMDAIAEGLIVKPFSSRFMNPIDGKEERVLVLGVTNSEDGQHRRRKTDFFVVIDQSGSMDSSVTGIHTSDNARMNDADHQPEKQVRTKMILAIDAAKGIFNLLEDDEEIGIATFDTVVEVIEKVKLKGSIDKKTLFRTLDTILPRGRTDCGLWLSAAIAELQGVTHK